MSDFRDTAGVVRSKEPVQGREKLAAVLLLLADIREKHCQYNALGNIVATSTRWTWGCRSVEVATRLSAW